MLNFDQTFKNIRRLRQIVTVLARHGFRGVVDEIGLGSIIGHRTSTDEKTESYATPVRLRMAFEELGPTFVKLGQMLSIRPDLIPREYVEEFRKLQDDVKPLSVADIRKRIEEDLEIDIGETFTSFDAEPLGAASIAQVHRAVMKSGDEVVVKVSRPRIARIIETDLSILFSVTKLLERYFQANAVISPKDIADEFAAQIRLELDFIHEAQNVEAFVKNFEENPHVVIPEVEWSLTAKRVLTMSYLAGVKVKDIGALQAKGYDLKALSKVGMNAFLEMVFVHGFFHGDIHGGNILVLSERKIGLIDFGVACRLDDRLLSDVGSLFLGLVTRDFHQLARQVIRLSPTTPQELSIDRLAREIQRTLEPLMGRSLKHIDSSEVFMALAQVARSFKLRVPQELLQLFRAIATMDSIGRELDPEFDVMEAASGFAKEVVIERYKPERLAVDLITGLRDLADMSKDVPGQLAMILQRAEEGRLGMDVRIRDGETLSALRKEGVRIASAILALAGSVTLGLVHNADSFGFIGLIGLALLFTGSFGIAWTLLSRKSW